MAEAVFFDLWNTLLYCPTRGKVDAILRLLRLEDKLDYNKVICEMYRTLFVDRSYGVERFFMELCSGNNGDSITKAASIWGSRLDDSDFFPETEAVLAGLRGEYRLGLISNTDAAGAAHARSRLGGYLEAMVMSCEVGAVKPDPIIYEAALEELGVRAEDSWMVGDNVEVDVEGALNAGLNAILIDRNGAKMSGEYPVVRSLSEVAGAIR